MNDAALTRKQEQAATQKDARHGRRKTSIGLRLERFGALLFFCGVLITLYRGWLNRDDLSRTAESGLGYALGIIGGVLMLLLLLYPARKRFRFMQRLGPVKWWFRSHMFLGIVGPLCILFHCNFHLGALNSNVSLLCMILVASSGLVGRYFYSKIHYGLYGRKATLQELLRDSSFFKERLVAALALAPRHRDRLQAVESAALAPQRGIIRALPGIALFNISSYWIEFSLGSLLKRVLIEESRTRGIDRRDAEQRLREEKYQLRNYLNTLRKINQLSFYERLFSWWHVLHVPLFLMLLLSGIVHVVAVHLY
jgi:hypothetical protein